MVHRSGPIDPQTSQTIGNASVYSAQPDGKALLLITQNIAKPSWCFPPYWLALTVLEGSVHATSEEGELSVSPNYEP